MILVGIISKLKAHIVVSPIRYSFLHGLVIVGQLGTLKVRMAVLLPLLASQIMAWAFGCTFA
jgi:hypothetical protein